MAISTLIRPKKWGLQKPPAGATISTGHPLATGLVGAWLFNEGGGQIARDLVGTNQLASSNSANVFAVGLGGAGARTTYHNGGWNNQAPSSILKPATTVTMFWRGLESAGAGAANDHLAGMAPDNANGSPFHSYGFQIHDFTNVVDYVWNNGSVQTITGTRSIQGASSSSQLHTLALTVSASLASAYFDGVLEGTSSSVGTITYNATAGFSGAGGPTGQNGCDVIADVCYVWNRALSQAEIQWLTAEPYAMIAAPGRLWVPASSAAALPPVTRPRAARSVAALGQRRNRVVVGPQVPVPVKPPDRVARRPQIAAVRRGRTLVVPAAPATVIAAKVPDRSSRRRLMLWVRDRGQQSVPVPAQVLVPVKAPDRTARHQPLAAVRRGRSLVVPPTPATVISARVPDRVGQRRLAAAVRRIKPGLLPQPQHASPPRQELRTVRRTLRISKAAPQLVFPPAPVVVQKPPDRTFSRRYLTAVTRGRRSFPTPAQVPVPPRKPDDPTQRREVRGWSLRRGRQAQPPWGIQALPGPPNVTFTRDQRRALRGWPGGRGRRITPVPAQVPVPIKPPEHPTPGRRLLRVITRKPSPIIVPQATPVARRPTPIKSLPASRQVRRQLPAPQDNPPRRLTSPRKTLRRTPARRAAPVSRQASPPWVPTAPKRMLRIAARIRARFAQGVVPAGKTTVLDTDPGTGTDTLVAQPAGPIIAAFDVTLQLDGQPFDLTGCQVTIRILPIAGGVDLVAADTCIVDPTTPGRVLYQWHGTNGPPGYYLAQFTVTDGQGRVCHFPNTGRYVVKVGTIIH